MPSNRSRVPNLSHTYLNRSVFCIRYRGEVLGLTWRNVDLDGARPVVSQQILSVEYAATVADVKTAHSRRTIDLDPRTVSVLRAWRRHQLEQKMSTGRRDDDEFIFTHPDAGRSTPTSSRSHGNG